MKKILFPHPQAKEFFYSKGRDNCNVPFVNLREAFEEKGYEVHIEVTGDLDSYEFIFFTDLCSDSFFGRLIARQVGRNDYEIYKKAIKLGLGKKIVTILSEPELIFPHNYKLSNHRDIGTIFTWKKELVDNKKYFHFHLPYGDEVGIKKNIDFDKKKLVMSISGNKFSSNKGDLYSYRRNTINFLNKEFANDFDLYGVGWSDNGLLKNIKRFIRHRQFNFTKYQMYRGSPGNKNEVISGYKFSICYENSRCEDYITEKIFDVFINESVPVYYGAKNISEYVPKNTFIDREDFNSDSELMAYLSKVDKNQYMEYIYNINTFLESKEFHKFSSKYFVKNIINTLGV
jgi:alpha(1,3/1,4) fucosyltransferase